MNYRGFGLAWLVFWFALPACAEPLTLGNLSLTAPETWQRATVAEENDFDSVILRLAPVEVYLPRQRPRLKHDEAKFIEQLEASWRRRHGDQVELDWIEVGGARWRVCRRPSRSGDGRVFQVVAVHGGEAYQLIAVVPAETDKLPEPVRALLAGALWGGETAPVKADAVVAVVAPEPVVVVPEPVPAVAVVVPEPVVAQAVPEPVVVAMQETANPVMQPVSEPVAAPTVSVKIPQLGGQWRLLRQVIALPSGKAWTGLAEAENAVFGSAGLVKGLGMSAEAAGIEGFLEGDAWRKSEEGGEVRQPFRRHWRVLWPSLPESWRGGEDLGFDLEFHAASVGLASAGGMGVSFELTPACAPRLEVVRWLDELESLGPEAIVNLTKMACKTPEGGPTPVMVNYSADAEAKSSQRVALPLPAAWEQGIRTRLRGQVRRLVLIARFQVSATGRAPGDAMFGQAVAVFVFGPEV